MLYCSSLKLSGVKNWIFDDALKWVLFMLITLGSFHQIFGQDQLGLRMGNYAGSWSAAINPANSAYFSGKWDIGLGAFGFYENNDILYFKNTSALHSFLNADKIKTFSSDKELSDHQNGSITGIYDLNQASNFGQMMARLDGPSFLYKLNRNYTIGLSTSTRVNIGFQNIPQDLSSPRFDNVSSFENKILPPLKGNAMVWSEIAPILSHRRIADYDFSIGITPKLLIGHESVYLKSEDLAIKLGMDSSLYYAGNLNFGITHANLTSQEVGLKVSGWGTGLDVGFAFGVQEYTKSDIPKYKWRAGFALLDLGFISFNKKASRHKIALRDKQRAGTIESENPQTVNSLKTFKESFINDTTQVEGYAIFTPAALSANFDYRIISDLYIGILMIQKVPMGANALQRPSNLVISPRFERKWYSIGTSLSLVNWKNLQLGMSAKLGFLYFGTENLMALALNNERLYSTDFYVGMKINDFTFGSNRKEKNKTKKVKCPTF